MSSKGQRGASAYFVDIKEKGFLSAAHVSQQELLVASFCLILIVLTWRISQAGKNRDHLLSKL